jgi:DNA polymerase III delta subunit
MPVIILAGDEEFELSRRVSQLKSTLVSDAWRAMNFVRLTNPGLPTIIEAAASLPFGDGNRMVLIDRCDLFTKRRTKDGATASGTQAKISAKSSKESDAVSPEAFALALAGVYEKTYLVFACPYNFDSTLKLSKATANCAEVEQFQREKHFPGSKNPKLETWCRKEAKRFGAVLDDEAIDYLLTGAEADLRQISSEIEKAAVAILPQTHITYRTIVELSPHHSHVFALADYWLNNQKVESLLSLSELLSQQNAMPVIAALQTMLSKWIKIKVLAEDINESSSLAVGRKEIPLPELAKRVAAELKLMPFSVERDLKRLHRYSSEALIGKRLELERLEFLIKSGQIPDKHALEVFVLQ